MKKLKNTQLFMLVALFLALSCSKEEDIINQEEDLPIIKTELKISNENSGLKTNVCYNQTTTVHLTNLLGATTSWSSSNNVQIISSNNTSADISGLNADSTGNGWIRATLNNGLILQEDFIVDVGEIPQSSSISIQSNRSYLTGGTFNYLWIKYNKTEIANGYNNWKWEWKVPSGYRKNSYSGNPNTLFLPSNQDGIIYIEVRGKNGCGQYSAWRKQWFEVRRGSGSNGWWHSTSGW